MLVKGQDVLMGFSRSKTWRRRVCSLSWTFEALELVDSLMTITATWTLRLRVRVTSESRHRCLPEGEMEAESLPVSKPRNPNELYLEHRVGASETFNIVNAASDRNGLRKIFD